MRVQVVGYALDSTGYAEYTRMLISALHRAGHEVRVGVRRSGFLASADDLGEKGELVERLEGELDCPDATLVCGSPNFFPENFGRRRPIGVTMCEKDSVPGLWARLSNQMAGLLVPSGHSADAFRSGGVRVPIQTVQVAAETGPPRGTHDPMLPWTMLSIFEWATPHKDPLSLLEAYFTEFRPGEGTLLVIKSGEVHDRDMPERQIRGLMSRLGLPEYPLVEVHLGNMSFAELRGLYDGADVYVSSHHSEGWGMPIWEAMSRGVPAVATAYGGNLGFMSAENSVLVPFDRVPGWANVRIPELRRELRALYEDRERARRIGEEGRKSLQRFTLLESARSVVAGIEKILEVTAEVVSAPAC